MKLSQIVTQLKTEFETSANRLSFDSIVVEDIAIDSRLVKRNSVFFALAGISKNGAEFIEAAILQGASVVVTSESFVSDRVVVIKSSNIFALLVEFLKAFYHQLPANIYGITGTNGKSSTAEFTRQIIEMLGRKSASIGTLGINCDESIKSQLHSSSLTTPDIVSLYKNLQILRQNGVDDVAIEVSSIGLEQRRIAGLGIVVGAFTNFTQDHLDYHHDMKDYFNCKMILFNSILEPQAFAVLNSDIVEFPKIKKICENRKIRIIDYGFKAEQLKLLATEENENGQKISCEIFGKKYEFQLSANGEFQAFNALCALGNVLAKHPLNENSLVQLLQKFSTLKAADGRMQKVTTLKNGAQIFIDFAHSPDALTNVLQLARKITKERVLVMFGCGGNRDAKKRPLMGEIASKFADYIVVTDDNPRLENPAQIRAEILVACDKTKTIEVANRRLAIASAIDLLQKNDVLILAGKGHEKYQIIGDKKNDFDEEKIVLEHCGSKL